MCGILSGTVARMLRLSSPADMAPLGALLPAVLSTLVEGIEAEHSAQQPLDTPAVKSLLALVSQLTTGAPPALQQALRQVDPLPDNIPALQDPAALVAAARRGITPCEQLSQVQYNVAPCSNQLWLIKYTGRLAGRSIRSRRDPQLLPSLASSCSYWSLRAGHPR